MALKRISDYTPATPPLAGTEMFEVETAGGAVFSVTAQNIADLATAVAVGDFLDLGDVPATYVGQSLKVVRVNAGETALEFAAGGGDVVGPASAVDDRICTFDLTTGKLIQDGGATVAQLDTRGKHAIYIAAGAMRPSVSGGCAALSAAVSAANQPDIVTLDFDTTTQEYAQFSVVMPKKWNEGTVTAVFHWSHAATTTNFGVVWDLQGVAVSNDDTIAVAYGTAQTATDTGGTTNDLYTSPETSAITIAGTPAAEDMVFFRVSRVTGDGGDTMAIDARLHGLTLYVTTDAPTDA